MLDHDQDLAIKALAHSIRHCIETIGPACTARLLGTIALDLTKADGHTDEATLSQPHPGGQDSPEPHEAMSSRRLGADQRLRRPAGYDTMSAGMKSVFEVVGMTGIGFSVIAYLPQMTHLAKEHCSAAVSIRAWRMWLASSLLIGTLALYRHDYIFISLAATSLGSSAAILFLARRYRGMRCATHPTSIPRPAPSIGLPPRHDHGAQP